MAVPDRFPYEANLRHFDAIVAQAQRAIIAQLEAAIRAGDVRTAAQRRAQLAAVHRALAELAAAANPLARQLVEEAFHQAARRAAQQVGQLQIRAPAIPGSFAGVSTDAVRQLQESLVHRLDSARQTLGRRVEDIYGREQRRVALHAILGAQGSPEAASHELQLRLLRDSQIRKSVAEANTGFVDRSGRRWALDTYANMAVRTITREAVVQGAVTRMASHGIAIARVSTHPGACEICVPFQGTLVSLDGSVTEWKGEAVSDTGELPPYHPNCAHSLEPVSATIESLREELELEGAGV